MLNEIDENNEKIHEKQDSDGVLSENHEDDKRQIAKWKKKDEEIELVVDDIIMGVKNLKGKVKNINEAQDTINEKTNTASKKVDSLSTRIQGDNARLKKIIEDVRSWL